MRGRCRCTVQRLAERPHRAADREHFRPPDRDQLDARPRPHRRSATGILEQCDLAEVLAGSKCLYVLRAGGSVLDYIDLPVPNEIQALPDFALPDDVLPGLEVLALDRQRLLGSHVDDVASDERPHDPVEHEPYLAVERRHEIEKHELPAEPGQKSIEPQSLDRAYGAAVAERDRAAQPGETIGFRRAAIDAAPQIT